MDSFRDKGKSAERESSRSSELLASDPALSMDSDSDDHVTVQRGRLVVKEIGEQTRKGGYHLTLVRYKHFALVQRRLIHCTPDDYNCYS